MDYDSHIGSTFQKGVGLQSQNYLGGLQGKIATLIAMLPLIQMYLLIGTFAFLPFGLVASKYSFKFITTAMFFIFSLIFMTYEWHLVSYLDQYLIESFNSVKASDSSGLQNSLTNLLVGSSSGGYGASNMEVMVNMVSAIMYVMFPSLMTGILSWAGYNVGSAIDKSLAGADTSSNQAQQGFNKMAGKVKI
jgi:hypothetical protein